ncbi:T9SS type B sorting domain-containing protein [Aquirufa rosea]|uniref:T9SS type B sorting domain-containing protein n=1 Tax=Aquirufa rosea TaxID=2509241 RepID=A0A4Q1C2Y0_9BACT|nr:gliding motility-associated C-terminal domain-containing protein [Aquirufa rosea]RXK52634.1 T9SS type B sorting domain-containing protein [Aquirufa rosea]
MCSKLSPEKESVRFHLFNGLFYQALLVLVLMLLFEPCCVQAKKFDSSIELKKDLSAFSNIPHELNDHRKVRSVGTATRIKIVGDTTQVAGTTQTITLLALDDNGNVDISFNQSLNLIFMGAEANILIDSSEYVSNSTIYNYTFKPKVSGNEFGVFFFTDQFENGKLDLNLQLFKSGLNYIYVEELGNSLQCLGTDRLLVNVKSDTYRQIYLQGDIIQFNRIPFQGKYTATVYDSYFNVIKDFNAKYMPVSFSLNGLNGTLVFTGNRNVLNDSTDFVNGVADLCKLGLTYSGKVVSTGATYLTSSFNSSTIFTGRIYIYGGKAEKIQITSNNSSSISRVSNSNFPIKLSVEDVDKNPAAFSLNGTWQSATRKVVFKANARQAITGQLPKIVLRNIGDQVQCNISLYGDINTFGQGNLFYFPETFRIGATMELADGSFISTDSSSAYELQVTITPGAVSSFELKLQSPQTSGVPFTGTNTLTAYDAFKNVVTNYNASVNSNNINMSISNLTGTSSFSNGRTVLNRSTDFVNGVANLTSLGIQFLGNEGSGTFTFSKQTGNISVSASMVILSGDRDGDGLNDTYERGGNPLSLQDIDSDGDGIPDYLDTDSDKDGISDKMELGNDADGDGIHNYLDTDSDNDGISDLVEKNIDTDGDGIANYQDLDSDNDGILDAIEGEGDLDGDGIPNYIDSDSDGDGIQDVWEVTDRIRGTLDDNWDGKLDKNGLFPDANGNGLADFLETGFGGKAAPRTDTDGDGVPDYLDLDSDGDSIMDQMERTSDPDGDGIPNYRDLDSDGDWLGDSDERDGDNDLDGKPNYLDDDSDQDGIPDAWEGKNKCATCQFLQDEKGDGWDDRGQYRVVIDTDGDGQADYLDGDSDNDTIPDSVELGADRDGDEKPNFRDLDSDDDGLPDEREVGADVFIPRDTDADGIADFEDADSDNDGLLDQIEIGSNPLQPKDFDQDGIPDYIDSDADGDGILDIYEVGKNPILPLDSDFDGSPDYLDLDSDNDGIKDAIEKGMGIIPVDSDGDGRPDFIDLDSDSDGIPDQKEAGKNTSIPVDTDGDGIANYLDLDSDDDGRVDSLEAGYDPNYPWDADGDGLFDFEDIDSDNDLILDKIEFGLNPSIPLDTDSDGFYDYIDRDSDNDGIPDKVEVGSNSILPRDTDQDGLPDYRDVDSDGDLISDAIEAGPDPIHPTDTDSDGIFNYLDVDSDNDGYSDFQERGKGLIPIDFDLDGLADYIDMDSDNDRISDKIETQPLNQAKATDTDQDGMPDYQDLDADNDTILDSIELGPNVNQPVDTDQDGIPDFRDLDADGDGILDEMEVGPNPIQPIDSDKDGKPDYQDIDSDNNGINDRDEVGSDPLNPLDTDGDGIYNFQDSDDDGDGLSDKLENDVNYGGLADCDQDGIPNQLDKDICDTYLTNGFSPNGDGINDTFVIPGILSLPNHHLTIFNRWGGIVYETDNYQNDWDGTNKSLSSLMVQDGRVVDGIYFYIINFVDGRPSISSYLFVNRLSK